MARPQPQAVTQATTDSSLRRVTRLNADWLYHDGVIGNAHEHRLNDRGWAHVDLPHDAAIGRAFDYEKSTSANGWLPLGAGAYRKHFVLPADAPGKRVLVEFEGVYRDAQVWINGHYLGRHLNGYLGFEHDLTEQVLPGDDNVLTVTYDNRTPHTSRWYTGEGIYRDVWLRLVDPLHVPRHGTYVTTPVVTRALARVRIETDVVNLHPRRQVCRLVTRIAGPDGTIAATAESVAPIAAGQRLSFRQEVEVSSLALWDIATPNLYTATSTLHHGDAAVDAYVTRFGIRDIRLTADRGLLLNGRKIVAMGGDLHHDLGCLGSAVLQAECRRRLVQLQAIGCNSFRLSHNPHAPALLDACDELGLLIFAEAYDKWSPQFYGGEASFESQWPTDLEAFVRRDRNHPCVYIWSMGNEVTQQQGIHEPPFETRAAAADYGVGIVRRMAALTRQLDPSRETTVGLFPARAGFVKEWDHWDDLDTFRHAEPAEMAFAVDVVSWNYTENMFAQDHRRYPQLRFVASESACNVRYGGRLPSWAEIDTDYVIGHYYWSAYDYLGESARPTKVWGRALIDASGWVTPLGRYYQSCYSQAPMVYIMVEDDDPELQARFANSGADRWIWYPMADHWTWGERRQMKVMAFTNAEEVELQLNGRSLGRQNLASCRGRIISWEVPYEPGTLTAVARTGNTTVAEHSLTTAGTPVSVRLTPSKPELAADGLDVACVDATLVDAEGRLVPANRRTVRFSLSGPATNAGVASGDIVSDEPWQGDSRSTWYGRCIILIRAGHTPGEVDLTAAADALLEARCRIAVR